MEALLGEQREVVQKVFLKFTPLAASLSIDGVLMWGCPVQPTQIITKNKKYIGLLRMQVCRNAKP